MCCPLVDPLALKNAIMLCYYLLDDEVWYVGFCLVWLVRCYCALGSCCVDLPFMAHSNSSCCIDLPFMAYSTDSSANCAVR